MSSILLTGEGYTGEQIKALRGAGYEVIHRSTIDRDTLFMVLPELDAYILGGEERLDATVLQCARRLRVISLVGTGSGVFIDERAAGVRGIQISTTPGIMAPAVAEHTIGLLIGTIRGLFAQNEAAKRV